MKLNILVATFAYIINDQNKVLLVRRAPLDSFPGRWELPGGGLDSGERPEESIEREVLEEVGLHVKSIRPLSVTTHKNSDKTKDVVRITYECVLQDKDEIPALSADHDAFKWVDADEFTGIAKNTPLYDVIKDVKNNYPVTS